MKAFGPEASARQLAGRVAFFVPGLNEAGELAQPSGHGSVISASVSAGFTSVACPLTEARRGVQQQWPSSTQQAIEHTSVESVASVMGAHANPNNIVMTAHSARSLADRCRRASVIARHTTSKPFIMLSSISFCLLFGLMM
jgi:hypothetical protein